MLRFDQLQLLLDTCTPAPDREIELQITCPARASRGLPREDFMALFTELQTSEHVRRLPLQETMDVFFGATSSQRGTYFPEAEAKLPILIQKTRESRKVIRHASGYEFVLTAKRERVLNVPPEAWSEPQFRRCKKRYGFEYGDVRYDFTAVFPESPDPAAQLQESFELELELSPETTACPLDSAERLVRRALQLVRLLVPECQEEEIQVVE